MQDNSFSFFFRTIGVFRKLKAAWKVLWKYEMCYVAKQKQRNGLGLFNQNREDISTDHKSAGRKAQSETYLKTIKTTEKRSNHSNYIYTNTMMSRTKQKRKKKRNQRR